MNEFRLIELILNAAIFINMCLSCYAHYTNRMLDAIYFILAAIFLVMIARVG